MQRLLKQVPALRNLIDWDHFWSIKEGMSLWSSWNQAKSQRSYLGGMASFLPPSSALDYCRSASLNKPLIILAISIEMGVTYLWIFRVELRMQSMCIPSNVSVVFPHLYCWQSHATLPYLLYSSLQSVALHCSPGPYSRRLLYCNYWLLSDSNSVR